METEVDKGRGSQKQGSTTDITTGMNPRHVELQMLIRFECFRANVTLKRFDVAHTVNEGQVLLQSAPLLTHLAANVTIEALDVT